ncbi:hypothetical protein [Streptomyces cathayae]|uniref:Uncharacterized protein n=1 Tax=Streptomyces cathayae TaxID=3031124 RepID=A0ABY8K3C8_9ACTN|nr:hypothetical protein [Streptomyces sp. HUAS 5]WGD41008.1 hypothetical protein PYS65_13030 [Streptomyces sp. HUAS 5]
MAPRESRDVLELRQVGAGQDRCAEVLVQHPHDRGAHPRLAGREVETVADERAQLPFRPVAGRQPCRAERGLGVGEDAPRMTIGSAQSSLPRK